MTAIPKFDFELLLSMAQDDPDQFTEMRSLLIDSAIERLDDTNGRLADLQQKINRLAGGHSPVDQAMLDITRLLADRVSALGALTQSLERELLGEPTHDLPEALPSA